MVSMLTFICFCQLVLTSFAAPMYFNKGLEEAEQVALESTGLFIPNQSVVARIMRDLKLIREQYPDIQKVVHKKKWIPGELLVRGIISEDQLYQIDFSQMFGSLQQVRNVRAGSSSSPKLLVFSNPYNPERMAEKLQEKFGIRAEPNTENRSDGNGSIAYNPQNGIFTIEKPLVGGGAYAGGRNKFMWEFSVRNGHVTLLRSMNPGFSFSG